MAVRCITKNNRTAIFVGIENKNLSHKVTQCFNNSKYSRTFLCSGVPLGNSLSC